MKIFAQLVRTVVNTVALPVAVVRDVVTLGGLTDNNGRPHTPDAVAKLKSEASE